MFSSASNIWKRHHLLEETIGYLAVEQTSYENITTLFYISVFLVPILTILELTFYLLYQCKVSSGINNTKLFYMSCFSIIHGEIFLQNMKKDQAMAMVTWRLKGVKWLIWIKIKR